MSHASLATRHRPQSFAEVTGQSMIKTILSRAAARDNVAPAYLFSGTRGVGKTTLARIFAKALNCANAPTGEPCNVCDQCRRVTQGNHVDVIEIDGASNTGVDDARRLKETIGYAPMEGRYKVFIIDEAHMLSRNAFNALLKTLEEPPPRAIFIMATTESHKFPATIISRCQHLVFQAQPESELVEHLRHILKKEGVKFEEPALRLIARRAAGSVRDGMSLMGQTLALGGDTLDEAITREVLGVAGQEVYERLLRAIRAEDCPAMVILTREMLDRGIDIGFFLRELTMLWRNLFLLRQAGPAAAASALALELPEDEQRRLGEIATEFDLTFIHAAWQMVLESQRQVLTSLEPAASLELLLLNLVLLPRLVSLETVSAAAKNGAFGTAMGQAEKPAPAAPTQGARTDTEGPRADVGSRHGSQEAPGAPAAFAERAAPREVLQEPTQNLTPAPAQHLSPAQNLPQDVEQAPSHTGVPRGERTWEGFLVFCNDNKALCGPVNAAQLRQATGTFEGENLTLVTVAAMQHGQCSAPTYMQALHRLGAAYAGEPLSVSVLPPARPIRTEADLKEEVSTLPEVKAVVETFDAQILRCTTVEKAENSETE